MTTYIGWKSAGRKNQNVLLALATDLVRHRVVVNEASFE